MTAKAITAAAVGAVLLAVVVPANADTVSLNGDAYMEFSADNETNRVTNVTVRFQQPLIPIFPQKAPAKSACACTDQ